MKDMTARVDRFKKYLMSRKERCIVIVGHSAFFRALLGTEVGMRNCEVCEVMMSEGGVESVRTMACGQEL